MTNPIMKPAIWQVMYMAIDRRSWYLLNISNNDGSYIDNKFYKISPQRFPTKSTRATYKNIPAVIANIQGVAPSSVLPIATPMNIPIMAVMAERKLYNSATYHLIPLDSRIAKSPAGISN